MTDAIIETPRLLLVPVTLPIVEAVLENRPEEVAALCRARLPNAWPGRALIERAFCASLEAIRQAPEARLWGDRIALTRDGERRIVGSVIFHGRPDDNGLVEVGYGVEESAQKQGFATEAVAACVEWVLTQPRVKKVRATTPPWHQASIRVLEKCGFVRIGLEDHENLGEILVFER
jgi:RimJ/RimL family protein N-acetyltransferase